MTDAQLNRHLTASPRDPHANGSHAHANDSRHGGRWLVALLIALALPWLGCGGQSKAEDEGDAARKTGGGPPSSGRGGPPGAGSRGGGPPGDFGAETAGVPVRVASVTLESIALFFETNGTLEAENDVDLVARTTGPVVALEVEQGMNVRRGQLLARIDDSELRAQLAVSKVRLEETKAAFERVESLYGNELVSRDTLDTAKASYETALGDVERFDIQLAYTQIKAPFAGVIAERYVRNAEYVNAGARLFRISDFDPLLCRIQVPERELARLRAGQGAEVEFESYPDHRFTARVARISPVVDAATGTIEVTLEVAGEGKLRPGMFASVFLEMERREDALVIPKQALALDSLGDTVFVAADGVAARRTVELGFENANQLEVIQGLAEGEMVIVVGQDGLSDGTPVEILQASGQARDAAAGPTGASADVTTTAGTSTEIERGRGSRAGGPSGPGGRGPAFLRNLDWNDPAQVERVKGFLRERGLNDAEIEERLKAMRARAGGGSARDGGGSRDGSTGGAGR